MRSVSLRELRDGPPPAAWFVIETRGHVMFHWEPRELPARVAPGDPAGGGFRTRVCSGPFPDREAAEADCLARRAVQDVMGVLDDFFDTGLGLDPRGL